MSLFEKYETYLDKYDIELTDDDKFLDNRFGYDEYGEIYRWEFPNVPKPSKQDLDKIELKDIEKLRKKKEKKDKLKKIKQFKFPVLTNEEMLNVTELDDTLFINEETGQLYLYYKKTLKKVKLE
jgi:hypothetical protein